MANFVTPEVSSYSNKANTLYLSAQDSRVFVVDAGLKSQYQTFNGADLAKGISSFNTAMISLYKTCKVKAKIQSPVDLVTKAILHWCTSFAKNSIISSVDGNYCVSLACRFMFFVLLIFLFLIP